MLLKGNASSYDVEILSSFNLEPQLGDIESAIKNKLKKILTELRGFKFMTTLALVLKKMIVMIKRSITPFIQSQKQK